MVKIKTTIVWVSFLLLLPAYLLSDRGAVKMISIVFGSVEASWKARARSKQMAGRRCCLATPTYTKGKGEAEEQTAGKPYFFLFLSFRKDVYFKILCKTV